MNLAIQNSSTLVSKHQHILLNLKGEEVTVEPNERVIVLHVCCILGNQYCAIQKKAKGLILLPLALFSTFNNFKEAL